MGPNVARNALTLFGLIGAGLLISTLSAEAPPVAPLDAALRERCPSILRSGLASDEFWPAMHAAEALSLADQGSEVLASLAKREAADDQQRCGLSREAVRAGDRSQIAKLLEILACPEDKGPLLYFDDEGALYNPRLQRRYAVRDDIPIMLIDEAETVDDAENERLLAKADAEGISPTFDA